jgi:hypothetical protein
MTRSDPSQDSPADPGIKHKTGFFGSGGVGRGIAGSIGDFLLQMNHMQPIYAPAMEHQRNLQDLQATRAQDRKAEMDQWVAQQQYKQGHPSDEPSEFARKYADMVRIVGKDQADKWAVGEANPMTWIKAENGDGTSTLMPFPRGSVPGMPQPSAHPQQAPGAGPTAASLMPGLIQRESGGRAGVSGPHTKYGTAQGMTQVMPGTGQEMAGKLGVPWRPDLMSGTSPEAADYQKQIGQAYLQQGFDANGGDPRAALMYYHGGPNKGMWGPKTRAYADAILGGQGGDQGGAQPGSPPHISSPMELAQLPSGSMYIAPDGSVKKEALDEELVGRRRDGSARPGSGWRPSSRLDHHWQAEAERGARWLSL